MLVVTHSIDFIAYHWIKTCSLKTTTDPSDYNQETEVQRGEG